LDKYIYYTRAKRLIG